MLRIVTALALLGALSGVLVGGTPASSGKKPKPFPDVIQLPTGFQPEGIEVVRTGSGAIFT